MRVDVPVSLPKGGLEWALAGTASLLVGLGDRYPACESELTPEIMLAANIATNHFNLDTAKNIEAFRRDIIVRMARLFDEVDFIICATNPDVAFAAKGPMPTTIDGIDLVSEYGFEAAVGNNGALTIPANTTGNPAVAIPVGLVDGLPVSMQIIGRHHAEQLLLELARVVERERPWPLVAPGRHRSRSTDVGPQPRRSRLTASGAKTAMMPTAQANEGSTSVRNDWPMTTWAAWPSQRMRTALLITVRGWCAAKACIQPRHGGHRHVGARDERQREDQERESLRGLRAAGHQTEGDEQPAERHAEQRCRARSASQCGQGAVVGPEADQEARLPR